MSTERFTGFLGDGSPWQIRKGRNGVGYYHEMSRGKAAVAVRKAAEEAGVESGTLIASAV